MADNDGSQDMEESEGGLDVPQLALGLSLIGLGLVLVYKALAGRGLRSPLFPHHGPTDITFTRLNNQITATVRLSSADPGGLVPLTIGYAPPGYVTSADHVCTVAQNSDTGTFQFTAAMQSGQTVNVTACNTGYSIPPYCVTKPFPP